MNATLRTLYVRAVDAFMTRQSTLRRIPFHPNVWESASNSTTDRHVLWERSRLEWWVGEPGDPALLAGEFLARYGLGLPDPSVRDEVLTESSQSSVACVYLSAAAGASMIGAATGPPSPVPAIPDLVVVVYSRSVIVEAPSAPPSAPSGEWSLGPWRDSWTPRDHAHAVRQGPAAVGPGDAYQANGVGHASAGHQGNPTPAPRRLAAR